MKQNFIPLFVHITDNMRMINTCKDKEGNKCIAEKDKTIFSVQVQKSIFGVKYWKTLYSTTDYKGALEHYKCYVNGYPKDL